MRDYLDAIRSRVVVFDGGMGATLEQFDLSLERDYRLPGRAHEALVLNRPDVIEGVHASMLDAGADVLETDSFQASRLKLEEWGLADETLEINRRAARDRPQGRRRAPLRRRVDRPDRPPPRLRRPDARRDHLPRAGRRLRRAGPGPRRGRLGPAHHRDRAGHPRGQGGDLRRARGVPPARPRRPDPVLGLAAAQRRQDAPGHGHQRRADDARGAPGRRDRPELLDRPRGHARRDPLPRRARVGPGPLHPERRPAPPGPRRRDDLPRGARPAGRGPRRLRRALRHLGRRRLLRHDARAHRRDPRALRAGGRARAAAPPAPPARRA